LREWFNTVPGMTAEVSEHQSREPASIKRITKRFDIECRSGAHPPVEKGVSVLERRREELENGPGGDHDLPYSFSLPRSVPQVLALMTLLAHVQRGERQP
jgi:hypothetical protein